MPMDPKKLMAMAQQQGAQPFAGEEAPEDMGMDEPMEEEVPAEDDSLINLTEREIEAITEMVDDGEGDPEIMDLATDWVEQVEATVEEEDITEDEAYEQVPPWVLSEDIWAKACDATDPSGSGSEEPWAVCAHVYNRMGGKFDKAAKGEAPEVEGGDDEDDEDDMGDDAE